jgi:hypothetical protein
MSWNTPREAVADVLSKLDDDAKDVEIHAWREHGQVYCTTTIVYPRGKIEAKHDIKRCRARCDC